MTDVADTGAALEEATLQPATPVGFSDLGVMLTPPSAADAVRCHLRRKNQLQAIVAEVFADIADTVAVGGGGGGVPAVPISAPKHWPSSTWYAGIEDEDLNGGNLQLPSAMAYVPTVGGVTWCRYGCGCWRRRW